MILITGATGFVGAHLALHLTEKGRSILAIYRNEVAKKKTKSLFEMYKKGYLFDQITWILADITDIPSLEVAFENVEYVYHCAAKISFDPRDESKLRKINIEGTANVVNFCLAKGVKKLCFVSSIAALGDLPEYNSFDENTDSFSKICDEETDWNPEKPHSDYAISKYGAEMELWRGHQEGLEVVIVNPGIILGPVPKTWNREEGSFKLISTLSKGLKYYTQGTTGFVGVQDVARCMVQLMEGHWSGQRYILVSENLSYQDIATQIAKSLEVASPEVEAKKWMTEIAWRWDWIAANLFFQKRNLTKAIAKSLHTQDCYSNKKVVTTLDFDFEPITEVCAKLVIYY